MSGLATGMLLLAACNDAPFDNPLDPMNTTTTTTTSIDVPFSCEESTEPANANLSGTWSGILESVGLCASRSQITLTLTHDGNSLLGSWETVSNTFLFGETRGTLEGRASRDSVCGSIDIFVSDYPTRRCSAFADFEGTASATNMELNVPTVRTLENAGPSCPIWCQDNFWTLTIVQ